MDVTSNITTSSDSSFNYSFDYSEYDRKAIGPKLQQYDGFTTNAKSIIGILTISIMVVLALGITKSKSKKFFGFQCYSINLMVVNILNIASLYSNDKNVNLAKYLAAGLAAFLKTYNFAFKKTSSIVFCTTTFVLIYETTQRYRRNIIGFPLKYWLVILVSADFVPLLMTVIQAKYFRYSSYRPDPVALYQLLWMLSVSIAVFLFNIAILCSGAKKKREENFVADPEPSFLTRKQMYPTNYLLPTEVFDLDFDPETSLKFLPTVQPYIKHFIDFHMYLTFLRPLIETFACLVFLCTK